MNETFASVTLFYVALKNFFVTTLGWTVDRTLSAHDVVLSNGAGVFLRLQKKSVGSVSSIGMELGSDADVLSLSVKDPDLWMPFDTSGSDVFQGSASWLPDALRFEFSVFAGSGERWSKRYRGALNLSNLETEMVHQDHLNPAMEPNFKVTSGTYVLTGV